LRVQLQKKKFENKFFEEFLDERRKKKFLTKTDSENFENFAKFLLKFTTMTNYGPKYSKKIKLITIWI